MFDITLSSYIQSGMVLQQHAAFRMHGVSSDPTVILQLEWYEEHIELDKNGKKQQVRKLKFKRLSFCDPKGGFYFDIPPLNASFNRQLMLIRGIQNHPLRSVTTQTNFFFHTYVNTAIVQNNYEEFIIDDVLIGEVWLCLGQQTMEMNLAQADFGKEKDCLINQPNVRILVQHPLGIGKEQCFFETEQDALSEAFWVTSKHVDELEKMSALIAHFGIELVRELNVPVGLIDLALSEGMVHTYISDTVLKEAPTYVNYLKQKGYYKTKENWIKQKKEAILQASVFYNQKLAPLKGIHIRGILSAQGENEVGEERFFEAGFLLELKTIKSIFLPVHGNPIKVVYSGLHAGYYPNREADALPKFQLMLANLRKKIPYAGYVAIHDLPIQLEKHGKEYPCSSIYKKEVALRMVTVALGLVYHRNMPSTSPEIEKVRRVNQQLICSLSNVGPNLQLKSEKKYLSGFFIAGEDQIYRMAYARLFYGTEIVVYHPDIMVPKYLVYAYKELSSDIKLYTVFGLQVAPFSTQKLISCIPPDETFQFCNQLDEWMAVDEKDLDNDKIREVVLEKEHDTKENKVVAVVKEPDQKKFFQNQLQKLMPNYSTVQLAYGSLWNTKLDASVKLKLMSMPKTETRL